MRLAGWLAVILWLRPVLASAQQVPEERAFSVMNLLVPSDPQDVGEERWNAYGQSTFIVQGKGGFPAAYTNANGSTQSLVPQAEASFTYSLTLFLGLRPWPGAEAFLVPEVIAETPLSGLKGLGASVQNFELQKTGGPVPSLYRSRTFLRQTIDFGGHPHEWTSGPMQLATVASDRRLVLTGGTFSILDVFDRSDVIGDLRRTFFNMAFMTHASWDFTCDARGFSLGAAAQFYWDDWALRIGRMAAPLTPDQLPLDPDLLRSYGDTLELEQDHVLFGQAGTARLLAYRSHEVMGRFADAIAAFAADPTRNAAACPSSVFSYGSTNAMAPDLCWVRRPNTKLGVGIHLEQSLGAGVGVFLRAMYSDGENEVAGNLAADRDLSFGGVAGGEAWSRPFDVAGLGFASAWISSIHARYLALGGIDNFVGDGNLSQAPEMVLEAFYSFNLLRPVWVTGDYQRIWNPGFNSARGPVDVVGGRAHVEF